MLAPILQIIWELCLQRATLLSLVGGMHQVLAKFEKNHWKENCQGGWVGKVATGHSNQGSGTGENIENGRRVPSLETGTGMEKNGAHGVAKVCETFVGADREKPDGA